MMWAPITFNLRLPRGADSSALRWTLDTLAAFLGVAWQIACDEGDEGHIVIEREGRRLEIPGSLQDLLETLPPTSLAICPWPAWLPCLACTDIPVLFGQPVCHRLTADCWRLDIDVIRTVFFMLSRIEELAPSPRDTHGRFPGRGSAAYRLGVLHRPVVDEQVALLRELMNALWPDSMHRPVTGDVFVSCDVDEPYERWIRGPASLAKGMVGALLRRRSPRIALRRVRNTLASRRGDYRHDPNWTFDWYMDQCERAGLQATFYFIARQGTRDVDAAYDLGEPRMLALIRRITERGHDIGLHGSYGTYQSAPALTADRQALEQACRLAGVPREITNNRQHFLRWTAEDTIPCLEQAGLQTDSSGGYSDAAGFRFGTSRAFRMWNWRDRRPSNVVQRPLIAMEATLFPRPEQGIEERVVEHILELRSAATRHGGQFGFLWHNSNLHSSAERQAFVRCIS